MQIQVGHGEKFRIYSLKSEGKALEHFNLREDVML